ncbi:MAG: glycosylasparaginase [Crocinitomicaceae bacterium]|nr:glycosylasparaginase [Crocinitomicaceae bacterium]|tara:strand:+ start:3200 stop:4213 length:1014 start_codon:yes stop_codon:yes gene_type:complete
MGSRRKFIKKLGVTLPALSILGVQACEAEKETKGAVSVSKKAIKPVVISTWKFGFPANEKAWETLESGGRALDAVESGVQVPESDPNVSSVGYGGLPDRDGNVTLDSCIMDESGNAGSVAFLQGIKNPIRVARLVMEKTPHVMLVGKGAQDYALSQGFKVEDLLTEKARKRWEKWKTDANYQPEINVEDHDTIGMVALDKNGDLSGACTTSGLAWKMHGRVGDSPIIGAALYVDNEVGAATATGKGEAVIKTVGAFLIVELMRQGKSPQEACEIAIQRIIDKNPGSKNFQVGYLALNKQGETGAYSIQKGFTYNEFNPDKKEQNQAEHYYETGVRTY